VVHAENRHEAVSRILVKQTTMAMNHLGQGGHEGVDDLDHLLRRMLFREAGEAPDIGKQHTDPLPLATEPELRLRVVQQLLDRPDFLAFLPTIEVFVRRHPAQQLKGEEQQLFADIQRRDAARDQVLRLVRDLNVSALKMELAHLALQLDWMAPQEFRQLAVAGARQLLGQPLTSEVVDIMCEISKQAVIGDEFGSDALPERLFKDAEGIRLLDCLSPPDKRVSTRLVQGLDSPDVSTRLWAGYALSRRLPLEDGILVSLAAHLGDPAPGLHERLRWIFEAQGRTSDVVRRAVGAHDPQLAEDMRGRRTSRRQAANPSS
jgi:hypothetical protein